MEKQHTDRIDALKAQYFSAKPFISVSRAQAVTEVYKNNPGLDLIMLRALAFRRACERAPLWIAENELIISHPAGGPRGGEVSPELSWRWVAEELDTVKERKQDPYQISDSAKRILREEIFPFWRGRSLDEIAETQLRHAGLWEWCNEYGVCDVTIKTQNGGGDTCPGYDTLLLTEGMGGLRDRAIHAIEQLSLTCAEDMERHQFYLATKETCDAVIHYAHRYSDYAAQLADEQTDPQRRVELNRLADICRRVPEHAPRNFYEALQSLWIVQSLFCLEENQTGISLGRVDQYLWPLLERDLAEGTLTHAHAEELLCCWMIKMAESLWICSESTAKYFAGYQPFINMVVGGQKREGGDATNQLTMMIMACSRKLKIYQPSLAVRIHNQSPWHYLREIVEVIRGGTGFPACHFDDAHIKMMLRKGFDYEDARDYCLMGCVEPQKSGKMYQWTSVGYTTFTRPLELAFSNGYGPQGERIGPQTGELTEMTSYNDFEAAVKQQLAAITAKAAQATLIIQKLHRQYAPKPLISCLIEGCLEKGRDVTAGGAWLNNGPGLIWTGLADLANGLMAIKKVVYEQEQVTLSELDEVLKANFVGHEALRQRCLRAPKYGNDIAEVDELARSLIHYTEQEHRRYHMLYGRFTHGTLSISNNTPFGLATGALPGGRLAHKPLADGISPSQQTDINGPTAVINSVSRINVEEMEIGMVHNLKLMHGMLESDEGINQLINLLRTASMLGNGQMQFSYVDNEELKRAQARPEEYPNLMIRVAGYSAFFVELSREVQDEIISRTVQHEC